MFIFFISSSSSLLQLTEASGRKKDWWCGCTIAKTCLQTFQSINWILTCLLLFMDKVLFPWVYVTCFSWDKSSNGTPEQMLVLWGFFTCLGYVYMHMMFSLGHYGNTIISVMAEQHFKTNTIYKLFVIVSSLLLHRINCAFN